MTYQHREFQSRLRDAERLQLYAQSAVSNQRALSASLDEAKSRSQRWEMEAKEGLQRAARAEAERDAARNEALMAGMDADAAGSARVKVEYELARVQNALAALEEARRKAKDKASRMSIERVSLLLDLMTSKDEVSAIRAEALKEKKALEGAYEEGFDVFFNYGYGCCAFTHNIYGSQPEVPDGMPDTSKPLSLEFFIDPRCPPRAVSAKATTIDVHPGEVMNAPEREAPAAVLETDNSEVCEHIFATEVRPSNDPDFFT